MSDLAWVVALLSLCVLGVFTDLALALALVFGRCVITGVKCHGCQRGEGCLFDV